MSLIYGIVLVITIVWLLKKKEVYNPYEESLGRSGYYQASFTGKAACTDEIYRILSQLSGHKRIIRGFIYERDMTVGKRKRKRVIKTRENSELLLIHESGVFLITSAKMEGSVRGHLQGRYWIQSFREQYVGSCSNYITNPFLENKRTADFIRWHCRDIPKIQFYSLAVFGGSCDLQTSGHLDDNKWSVTMRDFPMLIADLIRMKRRILKPEDVDRIYERLQNMKA